MDGVDAFFPIRLPKPDIGVLTGNVSRSHLLTRILFPRTSTATPAGVQSNCDGHHSRLVTRRNRIALEDPMLEHRAHYIDGQWQPSSGPDQIAVVNAATEEVMGSIPAGNAVDADAAARAARAAFASWSTTSPAERAGYLKRAAEG